MINERISAGFSWKCNCKPLVGSFVLNEEERSCSSCPCQNSSKELFSSSFKCCSAFERSCCALLYGTCVVYSICNGNRSTGIWHKTPCWMAVRWVMENTSKQVSSRGFVYQTACSWVCVATLIGTLIRVKLERLWSISAICVHSNRARQGLSFSTFIFFECWNQIDSINALLIKLLAQAVIASSLLRNIGLNKSKQLQQVRLGTWCLVACFLHSAVFNWSQGWSVFSTARHQV